MRCCIASIRELRADEVQLPSHNDKLNCKYCVNAVIYNASPNPPPGFMGARPGWEWDRERMAERTALKEAAETLSLSNHSNARKSP